LIFQTRDNDLDFENPVSFADFSNWSLAQFFEFHAQNSKTPLASLTNLNVSVAVGNHQNFVVERYGEKPGRQINKDRFESLLKKSKESQTRYLRHFGGNLNQG
jgi:hypothetical protein